MPSASTSNGKQEVRARKQVTQRRSGCHQMPPEATATLATICTIFPPPFLWASPLPPAAPAPRAEEPHPLSAVPALSHGPVQKRSRPRSEPSGAGNEAKGRWQEREPSLESAAYSASASPCTPLTSCVPEEEGGRAASVPAPPGQGTKVRRWQSAGCSGVSPGPSLSPLRENAGILSLWVTGGSHLHPKALSGREPVWTAPLHIQAA